MATFEPPPLFAFARLGTQRYDGEKPARPAMDECPHCGEPIDEGAESCLHCGSDFETGWKPETDYYAVDLPEDELETGLQYPASGAVSALEIGVSWSLVAASLALFTAIVLKYYPSAAVGSALILISSLAVFHRSIRPRRRVGA